ncbi:MAG: DnaJ domain-containing protein [Archangiaceae bacterium]|nr:DnaJ domain-containing protein [Archangiaceae bacterium]
MIAGLGDKTDYVASVPNVDVAKLQLSADERALFDRVGRAAQIFQLVSGSQFPEAKTIALLLSLRAKGAIVPARVQKGQQAPGVGSAAALAEDVDLPEDKKREILALEAALETKNHYELLGVKVGMPSAEIRAVFYELSRRYHPDRFFKKNIGSYRARIEHVYRRLSAAYETLTDDAKRDAYLKAHPELSVDAPVRSISRSEVATTPGVTPASVGSSAPQTPEELAREAERRARLSKHPYLARGQRMKELLGRAKEHIDKGDWGHAFTDVHMASQVDPTNEEAKRLLAQVRAKNDQARAQNEIARGLELIEQGNENGALSAFKTASSIDSHNARAAYMVAKLMWDKSHDSKDVLNYAQRAVENDAKNPDYHVLVARIMDHSGMKALAKKHYEEALKLDPKHHEAKKHVKGRWSF